MPGLAAEAGRRECNTFGLAIELDSDRPSPAKIAAVENAISQATFILEQIVRRWPNEKAY
jgi:hypothetical protein